MSTCSMLAASLKSMVLYLASITLTVTPTFSGNETLKPAENLSIRGLGYPIVVAKSDDWFTGLCHQTTPVISL